MHYYNDHTPSKYWLEFGFIIIGLLCAFLAVYLTSDHKHKSLDQIKQEKEMKQHHE